MSSRIALTALLALTFAVAVRGDEGDPPEGVAGVVTAQEAPLVEAQVYAYEVARLETTRAVTGRDGRFSLGELPAGVYKLIAFKAGFEPAVVMLSRAAASAAQLVELRLEASRTGEVRDGEGYWTLRDEIPADVLREIQTAELARWSAPSGGVASEGFRTAVRAETGIDEVPGTQAQLTGGGIGMEGRIGGLDVGVSGEFWHLSPETTPSGASTLGQAATLAVRMHGAGVGEIDMTTASRRLGSPAAGDGPADDSADFERLRVSWSQPLGDRGSSRFAAQYTNQDHFYQQPWAMPADVPVSSRTLHMEGAYQIEISDRSAIETGLRIEQREGELTSLSETETLDRQLEIFGRGAWRADPKVLVEYGMFTQMVDGSIALAPQGSVVVQLGPAWQMATTASGRVEDGNPQRPFRPIRFSSASAGCDQLDAHCYKLVISREAEGEGLFAIAATDREVAETLQMTFDDDLFRQLESLYLVRGDRIPEAELVFQRRVTPRIVARLESSFADGGGGLLYALDGTTYENRVRYFVTSLDTRFQTTATGLFVAFHQLEQDPEGIDPGNETGMAIERLQLMLSQDLNVLMQLASEWSIHLNFELSRGSSPFALEPASPQDVRQRVTGGLTVRF